MGDLYQQSAILHLLLKWIEFRIFKDWFLERRRCNDPDHVPHVLHDTNTKLRAISSISHAPCLITPFSHRGDTHLLHPLPSLKIYRKEFF